MAAFATAAVAGKTPIYLLAAPTPYRTVEAQTDEEYKPGDLATITGRWQAGGTAAGAGIPAFYTPTGAGTVFARGKEEREIDGRACVLERALSADFALVHALKADRLGNLVYRNTARSFNPPMAMAARVIRPCR